MVTDYTNESDPSTGALSSSETQAGPENSTGDSGPISESELRERFTKYVAERGSRPVSVKGFASASCIDETAVYRSFGSLKALETAASAAFCGDAVAALVAHEAYAGYSGREKLLAFFFTFLEKLSGQRSYVLAVSSSVPGPHCSFLKSVRPKFMEYADTLLNECRASGEIPGRVIGEKVYREILWGGLVFIFSFWRRDESSSFERSDAAVEKTVNLLFDSLQSGPIDSGFDLAKFLLSGVRIPGLS